MGIFRGRFEANSLRLFQSSCDYGRSLYTRAGISQLTKQLARTSFLLLSGMGWTNSAVPRHTNTNVILPTRLQNEGRGGMKSTLSLGMLATQIRQQ